MKLKHSTGTWAYGTTFDGKAYVVGIATKDSEGGPDIWTIALITKPDPLNAQAVHEEAEGNVQLLGNAQAMLEALQQIQQICALNEGAPSEFEKINMIAQRAICSATEKADPKCQVVLCGGDTPLIPGSRYCM